MSIAVHFDQPVSGQLRRALAYGGSVNVTSPTATSVAFTSFARELIVDAFGGRDPERAQFDLPGDEHHAVVGALTQRFAQHPDAPILLSMPGFGPVLAAAFLANTGGDLRAFQSADRLASVAGLAPAPRDSGRISGNHHRPRRFNRRLMRTCYLAALSSLKNSPASRAFYERKRAEGKSHKQALIALARRRISTLWAMLRDRTTYREPAPPALAPAA